MRETVDYKTLRFSIFSFSKFLRRLSRYGCLLGPGPGRISRVRTNYLRSAFASGRPRSFLLSQPNNDDSPVKNSGQACSVRRLVDQQRYRWRRTVVKRIVLVLFLCVIVQGALTEPLAAQNNNCFALQTLWPLLDPIPLGWWTLGRLAPGQRTTQHGRPLVPFRTERPKRAPGVQAAASRFLSRLEIRSSIRLT